MATWNNATAVNATVTGSIAAVGEIAIALTPSGTMTGGHITIEENDGGGWTPIAGYNCAGLGATTLTRNAQNCSLRARLDTVIAGSGSVDVEATVTGPDSYVTSSTLGSHFQDAVTPTGLVNGSNLSYVLPAAPNPPASLVLVFVPTSTLNPVQFLIQGVHYTLAAATITIIVAAFNNGSFVAWSRI